MKITATIRNAHQVNEVTVSTEGRQTTLAVPSKANGFGSSVNGGELLFLSLATCFCNDLYREAEKRKVRLASVDVTVSGEFGKEGEPAANLVYQVQVQAPTLTAAAIAELVAQVDAVAEVHNTLRRGVAVTLLPAG